VYQSLSVRAKDGSSAYWQGTLTANVLSANSGPLAEALREGAVLSGEGHASRDLLPKIRAEVYMNIAFCVEGGGMSKRKCSEVEMIGALKQMEAGRSAAEVGRELGVSKRTVYAWKAKYGGMTVGKAQHLWQLEDENGRLKKLVADLSLDKEMLKAVIEKNGWSS